ncbi:unnamed protein product [Trichogramma brassicae]|uniref:Reverse transcriptase Ty1/copia-type domain-containing protein n=1 Tax=Trichogramma brassicae TaxID=86971 RepID=A0A6H5ISY6_9HYME|nr:unnamed protein product [Trichogramma brassicae]
MKIPDGFAPVKPNSALKLNKALYGLKQFGRCWNQKFNDFVLNLGFTRSNADKCVYTGVLDNTKVYLALYVDDGIVFCKNVNTLNKIVKALEDEFPKVTSDLNYFVSMEIMRDKGSIFVKQEIYINKLLQRFRMEDAHPVKTPADPGSKLTNPTGPNDLQVPYREAVGSL